ncbi:MAG: rhodanese-like domain-containing protein [Pseudomonadales bacterium]|nr:rhodanese-like domain-containing protein [Pseudomonadales bacterium]
MSFLSKQQICMYLSVVLLFVVQSSMAGDFPLRDRYPDVPYITLGDLSQQYENVQIIDVRSTLEFGVIHIAKAINIPLSNSRFVERLNNNRKANPNQKIILYCNGHSCSKSYKATKKALAANIANVYAFDAGVFDWTQAFPEKASLMGQVPADLSKVIPKADFTAVLRDYDSLYALSQNKHVLVVDTRDKSQREYTPPFPNVQHIPLSLLRMKLFQGEFKNTPLIFIDSVGKQVRWLQYYLEQFSYKNYLFLKGGVVSVSQKS